MNSFITSKIFENSKRKTDVIAIQDSNGNITYGQLWFRMQKISKKILAQTDGKQVPIIVYQDRGVDFIISMLACVLAGCFYIPIVKEMPICRINNIIEDSKCNLALVDGELGNSKVKQLNVKTGEFICQEVVVVQDALWKKYERLAYLMYTSGTTGIPKGVIIKLSNLQNLVESFGEILYNQIEGTVKVAVLASFGFDSSVKQIYCSLYYGHTLVIADEKEKHFSKLLQEFYSKNNIYISDGTPSNMRILMMTKHKINNHVKFFLIGGENFWASIAKNMFERHEKMIEIINVYGPTECCVDVSYYRVDRHRLGDGYIPIGVPILNTKLSVVDETGNEVTGYGEKGELLVLGKQVGGGYTSGKNEKFIFGNNTYDNAYYTGDMVALDEYGQIFVLGRKDNQIKKDGHRIELDEISVQIKRIENITDVVVRKKDFGSIEKIIAYFVSPIKMAEKTILEEIKDVIPHYMLPNFMIQIEEIPINLNGKIDEKKLVEYFNAYWEVMLFSDEDLPI